MKSNKKCAYCILLFTNYFDLPCFNINLSIISLIYKLTLHYFFLMPTAIMKMNCQKVVEKRKKIKHTNKPDPIFTFGYISYMLTNPLYLCNVCWPCQMKVGKLLNLSETGLSPMQNTSDHNFVLICFNITSAISSCSKLCFFC